MGVAQTRPAVHYGGVVGDARELRHEVERILTHFLYEASFDSGNPPVSLAVFVEPGEAQGCFSLLSFNHDALICH